MSWCQAFVRHNVECISESGWTVDADAQKADFALSQGIALLPVKSWVGWHSKPCASDVHDAVVVMGVLDSKQLHAQHRPSSWEKLASTVSTCISCLKRSAPFGVDYTPAKPLGESFL